MTDDKDRNPIPFAICISTFVDSRTWDTLPGAELTSSLYMVWIESMTAISGFFFHDGADDIKIRLAEQGQIFVKFSNPHSAQFDLAQGLLTGNV